MKKTTILIILAVIFSSCNNTNGQIITSKKTDIKINNLKGKIESIYETENSINDENKSILQVIDNPTLTNYNNFGNIISKTKFDENRNEIDKISYTYNEKQNLIEESKTEKTHKFIIKYEYDAFGNITMLINGEVDLRYENLMENGELKKTLIYNTVMNELAEQIEYNYATNLKEVIKTEFWSGGKKTKEISRYNSENNLIEEISEDTHIKYQYNDKNNLVLANWLNPDDSIKYIFKYTYEYDKIGNWIKKTSMDEDGNKEYITLRKINYQK